MAIPVINLSFCSEPVNLHCPCCGQLIFLLGALQPGCDHLIFSADSVSNNWTWYSAHAAEPFDYALNQRYKKACLNGFYSSKSDYYNSIKADTVAAIAMTAYISNSAIMLSIATSDKGCGGMHNGTIHALFDFVPHPQLCRVTS